MPSANAKINQNDEIKNGHSANGGELDWLLKCPYLRNYLNRIGAELKNFRRAVVFEAEAKYRREVKVIRIERDGTIVTDDPDLQPNDIEQGYIKQEYSEGSVPTYKAASRHQYETFRKTLPKGAVVYPFFNKKGDEILMVQQRIDHEDRPKDYLPWTFWSDEKWRRMEPEGDLPLYGLEQVRDNRVFMIHEGAKAAEHCRGLMEGRTYEEMKALNEHPWAQDLKYAIHLGWIGGAPNPQRTDWSVLPKDAIIYLICDNDKPGKDAAPLISKLTKRSIQAIYFTSDFPDAFDLADPFPAKMFKEIDGPDGQRKQIYKGPTFDDLLRDATWATQKKPITGNQRPRGAPAYEIRKDFAANRIWSVSPAVFIHKDRPTILLSEDEFNNSVRPFSDAKDTAALLRKDSTQMVDSICYEPSRMSGPISVGNRTLFNTFVPTAIKPIKGDAGPWLDYLEHLIVNAEDREHVKRWCATLIARPNIRMKYALLLISEKQGVGKSTLGEKILMPLVGEWNASSPPASMIVDSQFNSWIIRKRLVLCNEIYAGGNSKAYNALKDKITEDTQEANEKGVKTYSISNHAHFVFCSNSLAALKIEDEDRRLLIPEITEDARPQEYWERLNEWLSDQGLGIIHQWALDYVQANGAIRPGAHAPDSSTKERVIQEGRSEGEQLIADLAAEIKRRSLDNEKIVVTVREVRDWLAGALRKDRGDSKLEANRTVSRIFKHYGLAKGDRMRTVSVLPDTVWANFDIAGRNWQELKDFYRLPAQILKQPEGVM